jgi:hypothetical protein
MLGARANMCNFFLQNGTYIIAPLMLGAEGTNMCVMCDVCVMFDVCVCVCVCVLCVCVFVCVCLCVC